MEVNSFYFSNIRLTNFDVNPFLLSDYPLIDSPVNLTNALDISCILLFDN